MTNRFEGKTAVVTGAAHGIGAATCALIAREGGRVIAADIDADGLAQLCEASEGRIVAATCDVLKTAEITAAIDACAETFGGVDIVFSNAGASGPSSTVDEATDDDLDRMMHLHLRAGVAAIRAAVPHMRKRDGGSIILTTSVSGMRQGYAPVLYSLSKGALIQLAQIAAVELAGDMIRVNCVCPGFVPTAIFARSMGFTEKTSAKFAKRLDDPAKAAQPLPRACTPDDIAQAVGYLASDAGSFVTGQNLVVDGGLSLTPGSGDSRAVYAPIISALGLNPDEVEPGPAVWSKLGLGKTSSN
ncbi:SDR family NAD(P)-dependent oxidoreductase [Tepidamorphus sp. 3E244]|uniref:SDR family NAD(P)-dependent oxidoreductase n=1 Tax=Tepidamorphus sp. 3E244 TaxID=3385498 RepID=UPI0038FBFC9F